MSNKETQDFLDQCAVIHQDKMSSQSNSVLRSESYAPPTLSALDIDQIIAHGGCSPEPCSSPGTPTSGATMGLAGVA